jgi:hypothetical protein
MLPIGNPDRATSRAQVPARRSATFSDRRPGSSYGASAARITRRSRARRRSFAGGPARRATCSASARGARHAAARARPCSIPAGPTRRPAFSRSPSPCRVPRKRVDRSRLGRSRFDGEDAHEGRGAADRGEHGEAAGPAAEGIMRGKRCRPHSKTAKPPGVNRDDFALFPIRELLKKPHS